MKTFQVKDLMVSLDTSNRAVLNNPFCANPTYYCRLGCSFNPTHIFCYIGCTWNITPPICHNGCSIHFPSLICIGTPITDWYTTTPIQNEINQYHEGELAEFKTQLAELQKYVDVKLERTPAELDMLEAKLHDAINEVRAQKAQLGK
ncbi:MAG TPA: hypothetical protein PLA68_02270 [Panacibacter sp.]|nr:hypothetical protein [Panacibacter sp.]